MKTQIKTIHEEQYSDNSKTIGVLYNYSLDADQKEFKDSLTYMYREGTYVFFNTIIDLIDYILYSEKKMKRAYMTEEEFDQYYDAPYIEGKFSEKLKWTQ
jgi:hypothetical protein